MKYIPHERKCLICRASYSYCPHCAEYSDQPSWRAGFDTESCRSIYDVINKFRLHVLDAKDAKAILDTCDLSGINNFDPVYKSDIENILSQAIVTADVIDDAKDVEIVEPVEVEEKVVNEKSSTIEQAERLIANKNKKKK